jgi:hypothetical protein
LFHLRLQELPGLQVRKASQHSTNLTVVIQSATSIPTSGIAPSPSSTLQGGDAKERDEKKESEVRLREEERRRCEEGFNRMDPFARYKELEGRRKKERRRKEEEYGKRADEEKRKQQDIPPGSAPTSSGDNWSSLLSIRPTRFRPGQNSARLAIERAPPKRM